MSAAPRVFIVDDHAMVRAGVRAELGDRVTVVGEGADVVSAAPGPTSSCWTCTCPAAGVGPCSRRCARSCRR